MTPERSRHYARLICNLIPLADDLDAFGAPVEAVRLMQNLTAILEQDFKDRFGGSVWEASGAD